MTVKRATGKPRGKQEGVATRIVLRACKETLPTPEEETKDK